MYQKADLVFFITPEGHPNIREDIVAEISSPILRITHVAILTGNRDETIEANFGQTVGYSSISYYKRHPFLVKTYASISVMQRDMIISYAQSKIGDAYDLEEIAKLFLKRLGVDIPYIEQSRFVCSTLAYKAYEAAGIKLCASPDCTPEELYLSSLLSDRSNNEK